MHDKIKKLILTDRLLGEALRAMRSGMVGEDSSFNGKLDDIEQNYRLMCDYMQRGFKDPQVDTVYAGLLRAACRLVCSMELADKVSLNRSFSLAKAQSVSVVMQRDVVQGELEKFVQDVAMASLKPEADRCMFLRDIHRRHYDYTAKLFDALLVSDQWSDGMVEFVEGLVLSPTVDVVDAMLQVSAVAMAAMNVFDVNKWLVLIHVYEQSTDERVRQRAFVGWTLSTPSTGMELFPEIDQTVSRLLADGHVRRELMELQMQIFYCNNADADNARIQNEIMPNLIKNNQIRITKSGIVEKEDDPMEDILDPGAADRNMEELEKAVGSMVDMQKAGSDIYFGGFSQMKRFPFFNELSNWFCPFYPEHPLLCGLGEKIHGSKFMQAVFGNGPFCDSDKYSFAFAMSTVIDRIPDDMREMLDSSEAMGMPGCGDMDFHAPAYVRRMYLQDLYRFFRLYDGRDDFWNPFGGVGDGHGMLFLANPVFARCLSVDDIVELDGFLYKHGYYLSVIAMSESVVSTDDARHSAILAMANMRVGNYKTAVSLFEVVLLKEPDHEQALKGLAHMAFSSSDFAAAAGYYQRLSELRPDCRHYVLNRAISQVSCDNIHEGMAALFKLNYEHPGDNNVKRGIAWGYLLQGKALDADRVYAELLDGGESTAGDKLNAGYAKWFLSQVGEAVSLFREYISLIGTECARQALFDEFVSDRRLLDIYGVSSAERCIMIDLV